ncbi:MULTISPECIES: cell division topological specificity factor MinE [Methylobacterium]|jgi:cell division topological specificity factor|uniref:Cell division topological specificity factor n=1 Tax=Methylobacterium bullatum TaxID=570505 RepID=A0A679JWX1_9HYPH|nr:MULTISPECIES: cell division topological specificity factor MinE [unclassified Methylobacterium]CAA2102644.1 Cell division topological specificity factor [Methylobacterium bullatum]KQO54719.1 cell division topological specificity factor [Methylobacterium sp. Leaf85]KQO60634.1 cell division topological specificity factor [Methylobacterium sp. Leaf86]KQO86432.1 cell division topological specificity factor [Methylobacterium sp. Leaf91]KQP06876.1 cell division topological specificity factor [Met
MSLRNLFSKRASAPTARDRLQLILAHERAGAGGSDLVMLLREEILAVIAKHVTVERDKVQIRLERGQDMSTLGVDIELPVTAPAKAAPAAAKPSKAKRAAA